MKLNPNWIIIMWVLTMFFVTSLATGSHAAMWVVAGIAAFFTLVGLAVGSPKK